MGDFNGCTGMEADIPDVLVLDLDDFVPISCRIPRSNKDKKNKCMGKKAPAVLGGPWSNDCKR